MATTIYCGSISEKAYMMGLKEGVAPVMGLTSILYLNGR